MAAGLAYYNKNEVFGDPFTLAKCDSDFDYRPTEYPSESPEGYGQEPVFETPATGQIDQPVSAGYGHGGNWATATPVASAPPVEQSSGWTWSKATPAQQANRFNM